MSVIPLRLRMTNNDYEFFLAVLNYVHPPVNNFSMATVKKPSITSLKEEMRVKLLANTLAADTPLANGQTAGQFLFDQWKIRCLASTKKPNNATSTTSQSTASHGAPGQDTVHC